MCSHTSTHTHNQNSTWIFFFAMRKLGKVTNDPSNKCGLACGIWMWHFGNTDADALTIPHTCNTQTPLQAKEYKSVDVGEGGIQLPAHEMLTTPAS